MHVTNGRFLQGCHAPTRLTRCRTPRDARLSSRPTGNRLYLNLDAKTHAAPRVPSESHTRIDITAGYRLVRRQVSLSRPLNYSPT